MNVLIACEYSGAVRTAFMLKGYNVLSCDLLPSQTPGNHYQGDVFELLRTLSAIPLKSIDHLQMISRSAGCPQLISGSSYDLPEFPGLSLDLPEFPGSSRDLSEFASSSPGIDLLIAFPPCTYLAKAQQWRYKESLERIKFRDDAVSFIDRLYNLDIKHIAIENPVGFLNLNWKIPTQIVSPHYFGDPYMKETCLWLKNLNPLRYPLNSRYNGKLKKVSNHVNSKMSKEQKTHIKSSWLYFPCLVNELVNQFGDQVSTYKKRTHK